MKRLFLLLLSLVLLTSGLLGEVKLDHKDRVANRPLGLCVWACLETAARHQGISELHGLVDWYEARKASNGASNPDIRRQMERCKISYILRPDESSRDIAFLKTHTDAGRPVMVGIHHWHSGRAHAILVTDVTDTRVIFMDPNQPSNMLAYSHEDFKDVWYGMAVVMFPDR